MKQGKLFRWAAGWVGSWGLAAGVWAANPVPDAPTVAPAPAIERPLDPIGVETPGDAPSAQHVWVPGHWRWSDGAYVWETGRWEMPPKAGVVWHAPEWTQQGAGYGLREGYWAIPVAGANAAKAASRNKPQSMQVVYADAPPPPPPAETIRARPSNVHVWIGGYWGWRAGKHVWIGGRWERPPRDGVVWVPARWEPRGGRYVLIEGHWREPTIQAVTAVGSPPPQVVVAPPGTQVIVVAPPPPPRHEVRYTRPSPRHVWVPGYWAWRHGRHVWVAGHYSLPPRHGARWDEPRWERRGGSYLFIEGRWR